MNIYQAIKKRKEKIAVVGLGYVGLPLAVEFGKRVHVIGFDVKIDGSNLFLGTFQRRNMKGERRGSMNDCRTFLMELTF